MRRTHPLTSWVGSLLVALSLSGPIWTQAAPVPDGYVRGTTSAGAGSQDVQIDITDRGLMLRDAVSGSFMASISGGTTPLLTASMSNTHSADVGGASALAHYNYYFRAVDLTDPSQAMTMDVAYAFTINVAIDPGSRPYYYGAMNLTVADWWAYSACGEVSMGTGMPPCPYSGRDQVRSPGSYSLQATVMGGAWTKVSLDANASLAGRQYLHDTGSVSVDLGPVVVSVDPGWMAAHPNDVVSIEYATAAAVPEAARPAMWLAGLLGLGLVAWRRRGTAAR